MTTFRNNLADPLGTRRGPPLVRGPQFENGWTKQRACDRYRATRIPHTNALVIMRHSTGL